ncbi:MAG: efflux RND transporter permease subunit [Gammaproteobacteria bacterium]|nr:efflux RND transporter permease subunit [Gammaproteobacteria bacterium]MCW8991697.1 efflux RND transporter permease subunit [Gammaproteobacteria bacterium]
MKQSISALHGGGLAAWSIRHPIGVSMIAAALVVLGLFAMGRLSVDLLPQLIYPEVRVRILDPGVPASVMEDRVTRQLEEQLAITEGATAIQSSSTEGASSVDLSFDYGTDIDLALRDASTRLDRAKRFLPDTIEPPVIYKRDPSQIPVAEFVVSSQSLDSAALRDWVDYDFSKQFVNLPGVAAVEVGGGTLREILIEPDQQRLAALGISIDTLIDTIRRNNQELPAGRLTMATQELGSRTSARFTTPEELRRLPISLSDGSTVPLEQLARIHDGNSDERIKVRLDGTPGVKISIQKQPRANTVEVVDAVNQRLRQLKEQKLIPSDMQVEQVSDQAIYIRNALNNATLAALSGTLLAMLVVYLFLGDLRRTLIIGSAIPFAVMVTFALMAVGGLSFNIMTLGGLALGVGLLVDNTIVMLENIQRHQRDGEEGEQAGTAAAAEINSAIVAATSTNLAAVLPFLFISGLVGLLFRELIFTISAAIIASMLVALTLVPAWSVRVHGQATNAISRLLNNLVQHMQEGYSRLLGGLLKRRWLQGLIIAALLGALWLSSTLFVGAKQAFLPDMDTGEISISISSDPGIALEEMDANVRKMEKLLQAQPEVRSVFTLVGGFIFGRTERESSNRTTITVQLIPRDERELSSDEWIHAMQRQVDKLGLTGFRIFMRSRGIRGIRLSSGDDDLSLRLQGPDMETLRTTADELVAHLKETEGLRNLQHSADEVRQELSIRLKRERLAELGLDAEVVGRTLKLALDGEVISDYLENDRAYDIRLRLPRREIKTPSALEQLVLRNAVDGQSLLLSEVAQLELIAAPAEIRRDRQRRIVEISASLTGALTYGEVQQALQARLADFTLPQGYTLYDGGEFESLQEGRRLSQLLLGLALFLVFVVMAVQYESLRNPVVILLGVPFAVIGVSLGLVVTGLPLSMPVWLGMIMLAGIVVNNAIILVEYMDMARNRGLALEEAITEAARLRLRPIMMTTLTTVMGMLPLALGIGEGAEMLQPLAVALIAGLSMSLLVTLVLIPILYRWLQPRQPAATA